MIQYREEPVAWYAEKNDGEMVFATSKAERGHLENKGLEVIPLYTHPHSDKSVKAKTLAEPPVKEITDLWLDVINNIPANDKRPREWHFANAILKKAKE